MSGLLMDIKATLKIAQIVGWREFKLIFYSWKS